VLNKPPDPQDAETRHRRVRPRHQRQHRRRLGGGRRPDHTAARTAVDAAAWRTGGRGGLGAKHRVAGDGPVGPAGPRPGRRDRQPNFSPGTTSPQGGASSPGGSVLATRRRPVTAPAAWFGQPRSSGLVRRRVATRPGPRGRSGFAVWSAVVRCDRPGRRARGRPPRSCSCNRVVRSTAPQG